MHQDKQKILQMTSISKEFQEGNNTTSHNLHYQLGVCRQVNHQTWSLTLAPFSLCVYMYLPGITMYCLEPICSKGKQSEYISLPFFFSNCSFGQEHTNNCLLRDTFLHISAFWKKMVKSVNARLLVNNLKPCSCQHHYASTVWSSITVSTHATILAIFHAM